jgi:cyanophycinase
VRRIGSGRLVVTAVASQEPKILLKQYRTLFRSLGVKNVDLLDVHDRQEAMDEKIAGILDDAKAIFFTGGDQLRITSQVGDTLVYQKLIKIYHAGGVIAGTSAGASVMCATMLAEGRGSESAKAGGIRMAPGLGLIENAIIDQHFAERGRMGRLLCAIAENPRMVGIGIDEDTSIVIEKGEKFSVIGSGAVYVIDGTGLDYSNIAEEESNRTVSIFNLKLHVLSEGDKYDLLRREPYSPNIDAGAKKFAPRGKLDIAGQARETMKKSRRRKDTKKNKSTKRL